MADKLVKTVCMTGKCDRCENRRDLNNAGLTPVLQKMLSMMSCEQFIKVWRMLSEVKEYRHGSIELNMPSIKAYEDARRDKYILKWHEQGYNYSDIARVLRTHGMTITSRQVSNICKGKNNGKH